MKYCEDSTVEKREEGARVRCGVRGSGRTLEGAQVRDAWVRGCAGVLRCAKARRVRDADAKACLQNAKTHLCKIICSKSVYIAPKTSISCRLFDLGVFFTPDSADYLT